MRWELSTKMQCWLKKLLRQENTLWSLWTVQIKLGLDVICVELFCFLGLALPEEVFVFLFTLFFFHLVDVFCSRHVWDENSDLFFFFIFKIVLVFAVYSFLFPIYIWTGIWIRDWGSICSFPEFVDLILLL